MRALLRVALLLVLMSSISPCPAQLKPVWERRLGGDCGPAAIAGQRIVLGTISDEERAASLRCYSVTSGELQWEYSSKRLEETYEDNTGFGIRSAPAISGQRVVVYSNRGELLCFDLEGFSDGVDDGLRDSSQDDWAADLIWKVDLRNAYGVFKQDSGDVIGPRIHPLISEGVVYCATGNGSTHGMSRFSGDLFSSAPHAPAPHAPAIVAVDLESGKMIWQNSAASREVLYATASGPVIADEGSERLLLHPGGDGRLYGIDPGTGQTKWSTPEELEHWSWVAPVQIGELLIVFPSPPPNVAAGEAPLIRGYRIQDLLVGHLEPAWEIGHEKYTGTYVAPACFRGLVYITSTTGDVLVLDPAQGEIARELPFSCEVDFPEISRIDDLLVIPVETELYVSSSGRIAEEFRVISTGVLTCTNVLADDQRIYLTNRHALYAFDRSDLGL